MDYQFPLIQIGQMDNEWINNQTWNHHMTPGAEFLTSAPLSDHSLGNLTLVLVSRGQHKNFFFFFRYHSDDASVTHFFLKQKYTNLEDFKIAWMQKSNMYKKLFPVPFFKITDSD